MLKIAYFLTTCGLVFFALLAVERPAYAYVDPGSGLFLLQGISSAVLGVLYVVRRKLKFLKRGGAKVSAEASQVSTEN